MDHLIHTFSPKLLYRGIQATLDAEVLEVRDWSRYEKANGRFRPVHPIIPWLGKNLLGLEHDTISCEAFKFEAFNTIDSTRGWTIMAMYRTGNVRDTHPFFATSSLGDDQIQLLCASFVQTWFYVVLLQFVIGKEVKPSYISRVTADGNSIMDTRNLTLALNAWRFTIEQYNEDRRSKEIQHAVRCCEDVLFKLKWLMEPTAKMHNFSLSHFKVFEAAITRVAPAIILLIDALSGAMSPWATNESAKYPIERRVFAQRDERLIRRGWCPSTIAHFGKTYRAAILCYADAENLTNSSTEHGHCSTEVCSKDNVDISRYMPKHLDPSCRCGKVRPDLAQITNCIEQGKIPILELKSFTMRPKFRILAHDNSNSVKYVAISHCWSDGLGGTTEDGIFLCQARRIQQLAKKIKAVQGFWVDSACIPRNAKWRRKAIISMGQVYRDAIGVIVLDSTINQASKRDKDIALCWRIAASPWNRRLWTYQESILAPTLLFELKDGLFSLDTVTSEYMPPHRLLLDPFNTLKVDMQNLRPGFAWRASGALFLSVVLNELRRRATSNPNDELLAISAALGIDVERLIDFEVDDRMIEFAKLAKKIPWPLIFMNKSQEGRIPTRPFRWLPRSFLGWTSNDVLELNLDPDEAGVCTEYGLEVRAEILELEVPLPTHWPRVHIRTGSVDYGLFRSPHSARNTSQDQANAVLVYQHGGVGGLPSKILENLSAEPVRLLSFDSPDKREVTCHFETEFRLKRDNFIDQGIPVINGSWVVRSVVIT